MQRWQVAIVWTLAAPALAQTVVTVRSNEFEIQGATARQLARELRSKGPSLSTGHRAFGFSSWTLDWSFPTEPDSQRCLPQGVRVTTLITITLPRWKNPADGDDKLRAKWMAFRSALELHERAHQQNAVDAGQKLYETLRELPPAACPELSQRAAALAKIISDDYHNRDAELDQRTDHGRKQGVKF